MNEPMGLPAISPLLFVLLTIGLLIGLVIAWVFENTFVKNLYDFHPEDKLPHWWNAFRKRAYSVAFICFLLSIGIDPVADILTLKQLSPQDFNPTLFHYSFILTLIIALLTYVVMIGKLFYDQIKNGNKLF